MRDVPLTTYAEHPVIMLGAGGRIEAYAKPGNVREIILSIHGHDGSRCLSVYMVLAEVLTKAVAELRENALTWAREQGGAP
jgi:hypothetical protein